MKKLFAILAVVAVGQADLAYSAGPTFYAGADVIQMTQKNSDGTSNSIKISGNSDTTNLRLNAGIQPLNWLDAELQVILPTSGSYKDSGGGDVTLKTTVIAVFAKPYVSFGSINLYGLVGFSETSSKLSSRTTGGTANEVNLAYGAGVQFKAAKNIGISVDYTQYATNVDFGNKQDNTISAIGLGVRYTF